MIELAINLRDTQQLALKEKLEAMTIAYSLKSNSNSSPILRENTRVIYGVRDINQFLDDLQKFKEQWYQCQCDKWDFD